MIGLWTETTGMTIMCREDHSLGPVQTIAGQKEEEGRRRIGRYLEGTRGTARRRNVGRG